MKVCAIGRRTAHDLCGCGFPVIDFATSRAHSMKRSTTGLSVRCFSVTIVTAHGRTGKSTGNTFSELKCVTDLGHAVTNRLVATKWVWAGIEDVTRLALGMARPRA